MAILMILAKIGLNSQLTHNVFVDFFSQVLVQLCLSVGTFVPSRHHITSCFMVVVVVVVCGQAFIP